MGYCRNKDENQNTVLRTVQSEAVRIDSRDMAVRLLSVLLLLAVMLVGISAFSGSAYARSLPPDGISPVIVEIQPTTVTAGSQISITLTFNGTASVDQQVRVQTDASMFTDWTDYVTLPAGQSQMTFYRTLKSTADGSFSVAASCNGKAVASPAVMISIVR
jgi:hypothetical protein